MRNRRTEPSCEMINQLSPTQYHIQCWEPSPQAYAGKGPYQKKSSTKSFNYGNCKRNKNLPWIGRCIWPSEVTCVSVTRQIPTTESKGKHFSAFTIHNLTFSTESAILRKNIFVWHIMPFLFMPFLFCSRPVIQHLVELRCLSSPHMDCIRFASF